MVFSRLASENARSWALRAVLGLAIMTVGCERPQFRAGDSCELNSECEGALVCRLGRCRNECRSHRDCAVGLLCLPGPDGVGSCQIDDECDLSSDCPAGRICIEDRCTNECETDADCPPGGSCADGPGGTRGCVDLSETPCSLHSMCPEPFICAPDRRCRMPCRADRDCRDGRRCLDLGMGPLCSFPPVEDAGVDLGFDAGIDAGPDGGPMDGGVTTPAPSNGAVTGGTRHSCATATAGLYCWGQWADRALSTTHFTYPAPTLVTPSAPPVAIVSGANHVCALTPGIECWGDNSEGQLGAPVPAFSETPIAITLPFTPHAVAGGLGHTCVVARGSGEVWCWGYNSVGQLGHPGNAPARVGGLAGPAFDVVARNENTCALLVGGTVACWGSNSNSQLGPDAPGDSMSPVPHPDLTDIAEVDMGSDFACARTTAGALSCWGSNAGSQLARPSGGSFATPQPISLPGPVAEVETGQAHTCARLDDGSVYCWGLNISRQVGVPTPIFVDTPTLVTTADELGAGDGHNCVRTGPSQIACWGGNSFNQLGSAGPSTHTPTPVPGL